MSVVKVEKIDKGEWSRYYKKYLKRRRHKLIRILEKCLKGDMPRKVGYRGWSL